MRPTHIGEATHASKASFHYVTAPFDDLAARDP